MPSPETRPFRLPNAAHVGAVRLQVSDLTRSIDYYTGVIGLRVVGQERGTASLAPLADPHPLVHLHERHGARRVPARGAFGLYHFAILMPDRPALGRFAAHIENADIRIGMADHLVSEALYLTDPDGLGIEVYADRPRATWQHNGPEIAMTTEPLNVAGVIASAGGQRWAGAPAGTTLGHVHLHVGSLAEADAFYHSAVGFDKTVWSYPGALFMSAGGYHHHLATNTWSPGPSAAGDQARLLEWELIVPSAADVAAVASHVRAAGFGATDDGDAFTTADPWGTILRCRPSH